MLAMKNAMVLDEIRCALQKVGASEIRPLSSGDGFVYVRRSYSSTMKAVRNGDAWIVYYGATHSTAPLTPWPCDDPVERALQILRIS